MARRLRGWGRAWNQHFTRPLSHLLTGSWRRCRLWFRGVTFRLFLQGLPALLAGVGLIVLAAFSLTAPAHEVESRYLEQGRAAYRAGEYALAMTCFERVCAQNPERPEVLYELALTAEALGQTERTRLVMRQLAPPDRQGYGEAHLWFAVRTLQITPETKALRQIALAHLLRALQGEVKNRELAHGLLGSVYWAEGQPDLAEPYLLRAARTLPEFRVPLAQLYYARGNLESARAQAQSAIKVFQGRVKTNVYDHAARVHWMRAVLVLRQFEEAVTILEGGWNTTKAPLYKQALAQVYADWCDYQVQVKGEKAQDQLGLVEKGLANDPTNLVLVNRLLAAATAKGPDADKARAALQGLLTDGKAQGVAHFALGVDAWQRGDKKQAGVYWKQAYQLAPHLIEVANTLAMHLADADPPDLPRALQIINQVLKKTDQPNYRDTRGQIYIKMGKWEEALPDLLAAVSKTPDNPALHRRLATVYEHLDVPDLAARHRSRADQLAARSKTKG